MISRAILVSECHFKSDSGVVGQFDYDFLLPFVKISQDLDLSEIMGQALLNRLYQGVTDNDLNAEETLLLDEYVRPVVVHFALFRGMNNLVFKISNSGLEKRNSENGTAAELNESSFLADQEKTIAESYARRLADFLCAHTEDYPEYDTESDGEIEPNTHARFSGGLWLGRSNECDNNCKK